MTMVNKIEVFGFEEELLELFVPQLIEASVEFSRNFNTALAEMAAKTKDFREEHVFRFDEPVETENGNVKCSYVNTGDYCAQYGILGNVEGIDATFYIDIDNWDALGIERPNADHVRMVNWGSQEKQIEMLSIAK